MIQSPESLTIEGSSQYCNPTLNPSTFQAMEMALGVVFDTGDPELQQTVASLKERVVRSGHLEGHASLTFEGEEARIVLGALYSLGTLTENTEAALSRIVARRSLSGRGPIGEEAEVVNDYQGQNREPGSSTWNLHSYLAAGRMARTMLGMIRTDKALRKDPSIVGVVIR
jgi:hypothetical protein